MQAQPLWILILLTIGGFFTFYQGVRIWVKRTNGYFDILLGIVLVLSSLFMIRHGNLYPPITDQLEPVLAPVWVGLTQFYKSASAVWNRTVSFDVEDLSK
ncbi:MAG: hypothetical protein HY587_06195 [Candidatus Omnitrophica bacterium]|nr:hypothetical protein [Candidatus Omnitrophota bacterium]